MEQGLAELGSVSLASRLHGGSRCDDRTIDKYKETIASAKIYQAEKWDTKDTGPHDVCGIPVDDIAI